MEELIRVEAEEDFISVINSILSRINSRDNTSSQIDEISFATAKDEIKEVIFNTSCNPEKIHEYMLSKGFKKERCRIVSSLIENKKNELLYSTLLNYNSIHGETVAIFDWNVKFVCGTSELKKLKYPVTQLSFTTLNKGCQQKRIYDLKKDMLIKIISALEDVQF